MSIPHASELCDLPLPSCVIPWRRIRGYYFCIAVFVIGVIGCAHPTLVLAQAADTIRVYSTPATPPGPSRGEKYSVTGTVIDAVTGEPIRKALVQINAQQPRTSLTDGDGRFQFEGIPAGTASLTAQKPGYFGEQEMRSHTPT